MRIALVGIGGYGQNYVRAMRVKGVPIDAVVDPFAENSPVFEQVRGIPLFRTVQEMFADRQPELTVISTPIRFHREQAVYALGHGSHVLVEKPIAATEEDALRMREAEKKSGKRLAVGFQWCYDPAMLELKRDIDRGLLGVPRRLRALVLWPRDATYYARGGGWAGRKYDRDGAPIFDSVVSNATAHYLMNMLWLAGGLTTLRGWTARVNPIQTYDTAALLGATDRGAEIFFAASHAIGYSEAQDPILEYEFENGTITFGRKGGRGDRLRVRFRGGRETEYGAADADGESMRKLWAVVEGLETGAPLPCGADEAIKHLRALELLRQASPEATPMGPAARDGDLRFVPGLASALWQGYQERRFPDIGRFAGAEPS